MLFSMYDYIVEREDGYCIFNSLYTKYVRINKPDQVEHFKKLLSLSSLPEDDSMVEALYKNKFVVDDDFDEYNYAKEVINSIDEERNKFLSCLVYVTDQCNFRCVYCPEAHLNNHLSASKWEAFYKYIKREIEEGGKKYLTISFFGGEPLLQIRQIIEFLKKLKVLAEKYEVKMEFNFTSNGYLLTPAVYDELSSLGFAYSFQITLDGFAEQHNKTRPLANGSGTWDKIIENLKYANTVDDNSTFLIRTNVGDTNKDILKEFHEWGNTTFSNKKFKFNIERVEKYSDRVDDSQISNMSQDELVDLEMQMGEITRIEDMHGFGLLSCECHVAKKGFFTLAVNGAIYKCENNYLYDDFYDHPIGYLKDDGTIEYTQDIKEIETYEYEGCKTCGFYPICAGRSCPIEKMGDPVNRPDCKHKGKSLEYKMVKKLKNGELDRLTEKSVFVKKS